MNISFSPKGQPAFRSLSQAAGDGGLALGTTVTSILFLVAILSIVVFLAVTKRDMTANPS